MRPLGFIGGLERRIEAFWHRDKLSLSRPKRPPSSTGRPVAIPIEGDRPTGATSGQIPLQSVQSPWIKDPSFVNGGQLVGGKRYIAFGDLRHFYLKGFEIAPAGNGAQGLKFDPGEIPISVSGLPAGTDGMWAPQIVVRGNEVDLFYTAGRMPPGQLLDWPSFRLHMASMSLSQFEAEAGSGKPVTFADRGSMFADQTTFGGQDANFAMIDPDYYVNPQGQAFMTYTVVQPGEPGVRPWQEFVRSRQVSPQDPMQALGPDRPLVDGWAGGPHDGVAEAQTVVNYGGKTLLLVSSHAGDKDQRVLAATVPSDLSGRVPDSAFKPILLPGGAPWESNAVGSTDAMQLDGRLVLLYQGLSADHQFSLGFQTVSP